MAQFNEKEFIAGIRTSINEILEDIVFGGEVTALGNMFPRPESDRDYLHTQEIYYRGAVELLWMSGRISVSKKHALLDLLDRLPAISA